MDFQQFKRVLSSDPENLRARVTFIQAQARIHGPEIYLEPLKDLQTWAETPAPIQDLAIGEIANRLTDFEHLETRVWECPHARPILGLKRNSGALVSQRKLRLDTLRQRLGSFIHKKTGMAFNLLPGQSKFPPFLMGRWGVTSGQVAKGTNDESQNSGSDLPHSGVDWNQARELLKNWTLRLPTEQEWTYACQAGTKSKFFWGDHINERFLWYTENSDQKQKPYKLHEDEEAWNSFGLVDMIGNTWEWVDIPIAQGGFLDEAKLMGSCSFASAPGDPPDFWFDGTPTAQIGFRAAATIPKLHFEKKVQITVARKS